MKQETKQNVKKGIANTFGSFGYLFCFLQWLWAIILYLSVIQSVSSFVSPDGDIRVEQPSNLAVTLPDPVGIVILAIVTAVMVIVTIYALISIPRSIVRISNKIVHRTAETIAPVVIKAQHKPDTKKVRIRLTSGLTIIIKLSLILIPLLLAIASKLLEEQAIDYLIVQIIGYGLACLSTVTFMIQYILARFFRIKLPDLW